jgi:hypothetical protein
MHLAIFGLEGQKHEIFMYFQSLFGKAKARKRLIFFFSILQQYMVSTVMQKAIKLT